MMKFFHPVSTFNTTGKTAKGRVLQEMALSLDRTLIEGNNSVIQLTLKMQMIAADLDAQYPRTRPTIVECNIDNEGCGMISASPSIDGRASMDQDYFRIFFNTVDRSMTIDEAIAGLSLKTAKEGGEK